MSDSLKGRKILITGGLGFVGSNLARRCLSEGCNVTLYDSLNPRSGGNLYNLNGFNDKVNICYHDILDFDQIAERIVDCDVVFNCAASTSHPFSMREPWLDMDVNSRGVINILEAVRRYNPGARVVHVGTTTQMGRLKYQPADEDHPEFPMDIYSANKCVSEKYVLIYAKAHGLRAGVVRLSNVYGPRACINSPEFTFNNYFIGLALQGREIQIFGDGKQLRNVIYVEDAVNALYQAACCEEAVGQTLLGVGDQHFSVAEIAEKTVEVIGKGGVRYVEWPPHLKAIDMGDAVISNARIKALPGRWAPAVSLEQGLAETKFYYAACLDKYLR